MGYSFISYCSGLEFSANHVTPGLTRSPKTSIAYGLRLPLPSQGAGSGRSDSGWQTVNPEQKLIRSYRLFFIAMFAFFCLFINSQAAETKKVMFLDLDVEGDKLSEFPFFSGLIIEETEEKPNINFRLKREALTFSEFEIKSNVRELIIKQPRENTIDRSILKQSE